MWPRFGIKVGNSTFCIAHINQTDSKPNVIANKQGDRVSQACLLWNGADEIECGLTARQKMASRPKQAVANSFQLLKPKEDLGEEEVQAARKGIPCEYDESSGNFLLKITGKSAGDDAEVKDVSRAISAFEVHVQLFRAELELARQYYSNVSQRPIVVLSIPSYYSVGSWKMLAQAADTAGFHVAQVIGESTAAVLAYGLGEKEEKDEIQYVLTIKCGGLFSHFALYAIQYGLYSQLDVFGPYPIGGRQFTEVLEQFICEEFYRKYKLDPHESKRSMAKIQTAAENCKHILTTLPSTQLYIDSLMDGIDFNTQMSRARFESLIQPVIANFMQILDECIERVLKQHDEVKKINSLVLLGATTQIPKLQSAVSSRFPEAEMHASLSADEVVAIGCARQTLFLVDPDGQELQPTEDCVCVEEELFIWHGPKENEKNAQRLLAKGDILPKTVHLDVKLCETAPESKMFHLRAGSNVNEVELERSTTAIEKEDIVRIEAEVDPPTTMTPVIRLRCI